MDPIVFHLLPEHLAVLRKGEPFTFTDVVTMTPVELRPPTNAATAFAGVEALSLIVMAEQKVTIELVPGKLIEFTVRPLTADESKVRDDMTANLMPPKKMKTGMTGSARVGAMATEEYDFENPEFLAKREQALKRQQVFLLLKGIVGFDIPGSDLDAQAAYLRSHFQPRVLNALSSAIIALTADPVKMADFS